MTRKRSTDVRASRFRVGADEYLVVSWPIDDARPVRLTAAERAVAELVAAGRSNAQIARVRGTSVRTVANQVATLLDKLGVPSRHHVSRWVARRVNDEGGPHGHLSTLVNAKGRLR